MKIGDKLAVWLVSTNSGSKAHARKDCSSLLNRAAPPVEKEAVVMTMVDAHQGGSVATAIGEEVVTVCILKVGAYGVRRSYHRLCQRCS